MCVITDSGHQCLLDWGRWAGHDGTVRRLGYPGCSAEQMAGHVAGGDYEANDVAELVDQLIAGLLEDRKRLVVKLFYADRLAIAVVVEKIKVFYGERYGSGVVGVLERVSVDIVKRDLDVIRSMVGGVILWSDKKSC